MIVTARCLFTVDSIEPTGDGGKKVILRAQYDPNDPEDTKFSKYTPWGTLETEISNPSVTDMFKLGRKFYLDLTPVEDVE